MRTKDSICRCLPCICDALRACEERVLTKPVMAWRDEERAAGHAAALDAAREAVAALDHAPMCELVWGCECSESHPMECTCNRDIALAAIDALKEEQ
tara:strand:+ start:14 stop:304 length:291 start_codon:yes stop_codon:yes gene_type:complete